MGNHKPTIVKGRGLLRLSEEISRDVTTSIPTGPRSSAGNLGITSVDRILVEFVTKGITKLRKPQTENLQRETRVHRVSEPKVTHEKPWFKKSEMHGDLPLSTVVSASKAPKMGAL